MKRLLILTALAVSLCACGRTKPSDSNSDRASAPSESIQQICKERYTNPDSGLVDIYSVNKCVEQGGKTASPNTSKPAPSADMISVCANKEAYRDNQHGVSGDAATYRALVKACAEAGVK